MARQRANERVLELRTDHGIRQFQTQPKGLADTKVQWILPAGMPKSLLVGRQRLLTMVIGGLCSGRSVPPPLPDRRPASVRA
jgi:hypothetical protein